MENIDPTADSQGTPPTSSQTAGEEETIHIKDKECK